MINLQKFFLISTIVVLGLILRMIQKMDATIDSSRTRSIPFSAPLSSCPTAADAPINEIVVVGERHHGTNWIRVIVNKNAPSLKCDLQTSGHWKHGFFDSTSFQLQRDQHLLVVTRDVFAWLPKMHREIYCDGVDPGDELSLSEFIRREYTCPEREEHAKNLIELRTAKYKNWIEDTSYFATPPQYRSCSRTHIRYEDVLKLGQEETVGNMLRDHGLQMNHKQPFQRVVGRTTWQGESEKEPPDFYLPNQYTLSVYTLQDIRFILDSLDLLFEKNVLHYSYDYVEDYLNRNVRR